jgi:sulfopyruvate decarboxylase alpha subunit
VLQASAVRQVAYVPDSGHSRLITLCQADRSMHTVMLTTEEEGVAMLAGAWLGGQRGALLMQSSGVGNCINMLGLIQECRFPLLMLVTMRGQWGESNPWQVPMGQATAGALAEVQVIVQPVDEAKRVAETVESASRLAFDSGRAVAVVIGQRVMGSKKFGR